MNMNVQEVERIRKINSTKKYGHIDSAVSHCAFLLNYIDLLTKRYLRAIGAPGNILHDEDMKEDMKEENVNVDDQRL
jgi:hypothetical protein